ncbi:MAG: ATP-dependent sacrificial sulfur transferase LarE [Clostridia bacterium]|nr:ATP-dependent sacrificial sulfur transferase LarE [Clostridia bacterium]
MHINEFFNRYPNCAIAFSGGVDSSYLLYAASRYASSYKVYYVKTAFQPEFEYEDAKRIADMLCADMSVIELDILDDESVISNPPDRCYHCKKRIFSAIADRAQRDGFDVLLDGTNASDDPGDRPGTKALNELNVLSPLRICGLTKKEVRRLSKEAGLFTWDKPAYACLATRILNNKRITKKDLERTEISEKYLASLGFRDFRVRTVGNDARIEVTGSQLPMLIEKRSDIYSRLSEYYDSVLIDMETRNEE